MAALLVRTQWKGLFSRVLTALLLGSLSVATMAQIGAVVANSGFVVFGRVNLPDQKPAARVKVYLETGAGVRRDTITDDQGMYEIRGLSAGRFNMSAVNPNDSNQYTDPTSSDSTRSYSNRLQIDLYLRYPLHSRKDPPPGTTNALEAAIPKAARKAFEQGLKLQKENRTEQALPQFTQAIDLYPEYFQAITERANLLMQQNKLTEAEADFERAVHLNAKYPPALRGLGYCQIQQKKFGAALGTLEKAYSLEPGIPMTLLLLGYANLSVSHYEEAKQCLQEALRLDATSTARAHVYLAEVFSHEQKFKEAADEIRAYLKVKPEAADATQLKEMETKWRTQSKSALK